jgi:hypothetical protein
MIHCCYDDDDYVVTMTECCYGDDDDYIFTMIECSYDDLTMLRQ